MGLLNKFRKEDQKKGYEEEVLNNLSTLMNTKQQFGAWQKGLGLKNYSNYSSYSGVAKKIIADIEYNITHFEKRIRLIGIELVKSKSPFYIKFQIKCKIGGNFHSFYIGFTNYSEPISLEVKKSESN